MSTNLVISKASAPIFGELNNNEAFESRDGNYYLKINNKEAIRICSKFTKMPLNVPFNSDTKVVPVKHLTIEIVV